MASSSGRNSVGAEPNASHLGTPVMEFNNQFEQQQSAINELKEGLRKNEQQISGKEKELEEYASKLNSIKSRSRASVRSPRPPDKDAGSSEPTVPSPKDAEKLTPSKSLVLLRQKVNENKMILEQRGREQVENKRGVAVMVEHLKTQLAQRDSTIQLLQTKLSSPDVSARLHLNTTSVGDGARKHLDLSDQTKTDVDEPGSTAQHVRVTELTNKIFDLQGVIVGLQENLLEKDSVINARTRAIALMSEDLCRKGKTTLDQLEETREEMRLMQNNFVAHEGEMNKEKTDLYEQLALKDHRLQQLEETNNELAVIRNELTTRISEIQNSQDVGNTSALNALAEANKQIVKLKAQTKKQLKQLSSLKKEPIDSNRISDLENKIAELEEEKGNLQLLLVDFDDIKVSEGKSIERIAHLEAELKTKDSLLDEMMLKLAMIPAIESEKNFLEERVAGITNQLEEMEQRKVLAELKSVQLEEDFDILTKEKANLAEMLAEKTAEQLEYVPQPLTKIRAMQLQNMNDDLMEPCTQTLLETMGMAGPTLDGFAFEVTKPEAQEEGHAASTQTSLETVEAAIQTVKSEIFELATGLMVLERNASLTEMVDYGQEYESSATQTLEVIHSTVGTQTVEAIHSTVDTQTVEAIHSTVDTQTVEAIHSTADTQTVEASHSTVATQTKKQAAEKSSKDNTLMEKTMVSLLGSSSIDDCIQQINKLKMDNDNFKARISKYQTIISTKETELLSVQKEIEQTRAEFETRISELVSKDECMKTLYSNMQMLDASLEQKNAALQDSTAKNCSQLDKIKKLAANLKARTLQLKSSQENVKELQTTINDKDNCISKLKMEKEEMNVARQEIINSKQELLAQCEADKFKLENSAREYAGLEQEFHQFKGQSAWQLSEAENAIRSITSQISVQQEEMDQLKSVLQEREGYIQTLLQERESRDTEFRLSINSVREENNKRLEQISMLEEMHASSEMTAKSMAEEKARLESDLNESQMLVTDNNVRFQQSLAANEAKLHEQEAVCEALDLDLNKTRDRVQRLEKTLDDNEELQKRLRLENESLSVKYQESERSLQEASSIQFSLEQKLGELLADIEALRKKLQYEEENGWDYTETVLELRSQVSTLEKTLGTAQNKFDALCVENNRLSSFEQEFMITSDKLNTLESELKRATAGFYQESNYLVEELQKSSANLEDMCSRFDECDGDRRVLAAKCEQLTSEKLTMEREVEELNSTTSKQSAEIKELVVCIQDMGTAQQHLKKDAENWMAAEQALHSQLSAATVKYEQLKGLVSKSGALKEVCRKEVSSIILAAQAHVLQQPEPEVEHEWSWGSEDALLEEQHQHQTSTSVTLLEAEIKKLQAQNTHLMEDLKNAQLLSGKLVKKVKELKSSNETLSSQLKFTTNSLDQTMEIEFASQMSNLEKEVLALKAEKDTLVTENHKMSTKLEALLWQLSELKDDKARLTEEVDWNNKALVEKESKLSELNRVINTAMDEKTTMTSDETFVEISSDSEKTKDPEVELKLTALLAEFENINRHCENLEHELEAREVEIIDLKNTSLNRTDELQNVLELEKSLNEEIESLKLDLSSRVFETNRLSHVLLEQEKKLFEVNSKFLARDRDANSLETLLEMKNAEIEDLSQELKEHLHVIHLLKAVQNDRSPPPDQSQPASTLSTPPFEASTKPSFNEQQATDDENDELDHALYRLHQKEVRCDELTIELMQLLEERDTLQLRLSVALRMNEKLKTSQKASAKSATDKTTADSPQRNSHVLTPADSEIRPEVLANKLDQLRCVGREQRQMALQQQQRGNVAIDANYTMPREQENEQGSFFEWIWGHSSPKVMHI